MRARLELEYEPSHGLGLESGRDFHANHGRNTPMTAETALGSPARLNPLLQFLRRHPLLSYFVIAYAFTSAYDLLILRPFPDFVSFPRDFGPSLAAVIVTAAVAGKSGLTQLLRRLVLWRVPF